MFTFWSKVVNTISILANTKFPVAPALLPLLDSSRVPITKTSHECPSTHCSQEISGSYLLLISFIWNYHQLDLSMQRLHLCKTVRGQMMRSRKPFMPLDFILTCYCFILSCYTHFMGHRCAFNFSQDWNVYFLLFKILIKCPGIKQSTPGSNYYIELQREYLQFRLQQLAMYSFINFIRGHSFLQFVEKWIKAIKM